MTTRRHSRTFRSFHISSFALLLTLAGACGGGGEPEPVGLVLPLSGQAKVYGRSLERGARLAQKQLEERSGKGEAPLTLVVRDSASHPQRAAEQARELYDQGAVAVIGGATNPEARAMSQVAADVKRVLISPSASNAELAGSSRYVFRLSPSDYQQAIKMGGFAVMSLELTKAAVLMPSSAAGRELGGVFRAEFERQGGEVLREATYSEGPEGTVGAGDAEGVTRAVEAALEPHPQAIYLAASGGDPAARRILQELARRGFHGTVMTTSAFAAPGLFEGDRAGTDGLIVSGTPFDPAGGDPEVAAFVEAYRAEYDAEPDAYAAQAYDAVMALAEAMKAERSNARELWKGLRGLSGYQGVTGVIQFDEQGNVGQFPRVYVVEGGKLEEMEADNAKRRLASFDSTTGAAVAPVAVQLLP
jgi:branched-chain amino acid transport system substrate-binding protein